MSWLTRWVPRGILPRASPRPDPIWELSVAAGTAILRPDDGGALHVGRESLEQFARLRELALSGRVGAVMIAPLGGDPPAVEERVHPADLQLGFSVPLVVGVTGLVVGPDLAVIAGASFVLATPCTRFADWLSTDNGPSGFGPRLAHRLTPHELRRLCLAGPAGVIEGPRARDLGLVDGIVESSAIVDRCLALARTLADATA